MSRPECINCEFKARSPANGNWICTKIQHEFREVQSSAWHAYRIMRAKDEDGGTYEGAQNAWNAIKQYIKGLEEALGLEPEREIDE